MKNFDIDASITDDSGGRYILQFDNMTFKPTDNLWSLATLLFGLRPRGIAFNTARPFAADLQTLLRIGFTLHGHANSQKRVPVALLQKWVDSAVGLAGDAATAAHVRVLINANLGPYAWDEPVEVGQ